MKKTGNLKRIKDTPANDIADKAKAVLTFIEEQGIKIDKASLAKYIVLAMAIVYGIRKSNVLGSITVSLITGLITKLLADKLEEDITLVEASHTKSK